MISNPGDISGRENEYPGEDNEGINDEENEERMNL
jgi:hypothetical protein